MGRDDPSTLVDEQAERNRDVEIDAQDVGLNGSAKTNGSIEIDQTFDEGAARFGRSLNADDSAHQSIKHVGTHIELQCIDRALSHRGVYWGGGRTVFWSGGDGGNDRRCVFLGFFVFWWARCHGQREEEEGGEDE